MRRQAFSRVVPEEYIALGKEIVATREAYEDLMIRYRAMTVELSERIYTTSLADTSPFSYSTLRAWIWDAVSDGEVQIIHDKAQATLPGF